MWEIIFLSRRQRQEWTQWRWMQDTTVGAWVVMLHEQCMGWVPSILAMYMHGMYMHILVCIHVCTVSPNHVQVVRIPDVSDAIIEC